MTQQPDDKEVTTLTENLRTLANAFRDSGKYAIAGALYLRAIALLENIDRSETRYCLLTQLLEDQTCLVRRVKCGHPAW